MAAGINIMVWHETTVGICQLQARHYKPAVRKSHPGTRLLTIWHACMLLLQALSPVGRCQSFDAAADGYGRGEGFSAVVMTQRGIAGDGSVKAVICGSAVNQDGRSSSLTAPNGPSQQALLGAALASAMQLPGTVGIMAVHGTGDACHWCADDVRRQGARNYLG